MTLFKHLQAEKGTSRIMISAFFFLGRITYKPERMINVLRSKQASGLSSFRKQKGESPSLCMINLCLFVLVLVLVVVERGRGKGCVMSNALF